MKLNREILEILMSNDNLTSPELIDVYLQKHSHRISLNRLRKQIATVLPRMLRNNLINREGTRRHYRYSITNKGLQFLAQLNIEKNFRR